MADSFAGKEAINTKDATIYLQIDGKNIPMIECKKFSAKLSKNKEDVSVLGNHMKMKKTTSMEGTGSLGGYLVNSNWLKYGLDYVNGGKDMYFGAVCSIEDSNTTHGRQTIQLGEVNLDEVPIVDFESDDGLMEYDTDFTFEKITLPEEFNK